MGLTFLISMTIWLLIFVPMVLISFPCVALLLLTPWSGGTTWFGNVLYPRGVGNKHMPANPTYWQQWNFLCLRNPASNFGKQVLAVQDAPWVWLEEKHLFDNWYWKYGWKNPDVRTGGLRTFICRPWQH